ncbi:MAG: Com family DNA-binding transcriptional regulator [Bacillota bacterium]
MPKTKSPEEIEAIEETEEIGAQSELAELHCIGCGRLLLKEAMLIGKIEIKCGSCGVINTVEKTVITTKIDVNRKFKKKGNAKK